jgi:hypothetical protein
VETKKRTSTTSAPAEFTHQGNGLKMNNQSGVAESRHNGIEASSNLKFTAQPAMIDSKFNGGVNTTQKQYGTAHEIGQDPAMQNGTRGPRHLSTVIH